MSTNRREFLGLAACAVTVGAVASLVPAPLRAARLPRLTVERRSLDVAGKAASVYGIQQPDGTHGLRLGAGQRFALELNNALNEATIVHWHGQTPPYEQDGVMDDKRPMLMAGETRLYDFAARSGTHWMHSHHGLQEQSLLAAPLIVRSKEDESADEQEIVILLHDFTFRDPQEILSQLRTTPSADDGMELGVQQVMALSPTGRAEYQTMLRQMMTEEGAMDMNDVVYDAFLANDRTLSDPEVVPVAAGGHVRLRIINGATTTGFHLDLGKLMGQLIAVDGVPIHPLMGRRFALSMGQRIDVRLAMPKLAQAWPIIAQCEGSVARTGIILAPRGAPINKMTSQAQRKATALDLTLEQSLRPITPLLNKPIDTTHQILLTGSMAGYQWSINGQPHGQHMPLQVKQGQRVALEFSNLSMMSHPMHLHGHVFQIVSINGKAVQGAVRDTVLVPVGTTIQVVFDADNVGSWPLHCHNLLHMASGMMTEILYAV